MMYVKYVIMNIFLKIALSHFFLLTDMQLFIGLILIKIIREPRLIEVTQKNALSQILIKHKQIVWNLL